jgi:uncharacterized Zn finger protein
MRTPLVRCPVCGDMTERRLVPRSLYPPSIIVALGGPPAALVFECSRKQRLRCQRCGTVFSKHTVRSAFFQLFWLWFVLSLAAMMVMLIAGYRTH